MCVMLHVHACTAFGRAPNALMSRQDNDRQESPTMPCLWHTTCDLMTGHAVASAAGIFMHHEQLLMVFV